MINDRLKFLMDLISKKKKWNQFLYQLLDTNSFSQFVNNINV